MRITKDFASGLLFAATGVGAMVIARDYALGTASRMGPGYFPLILGGAIAIVGSAIVIRALLYPDSSEPLGEWRIRPLFFVLAAVLVFGALVEATGLVVGIAALVLVSRLGGHEGGVAELGVMVLVLSILAVAIFFYGLGMPLPVGFW